MEFQELMIVTISGLGLIKVISYSIKFVMWVWITFLRAPKNLKDEYGPWAVVTGATDGIGKALAFELASKGLSLILVGRNASKLEATSTEIIVSLSSSKSSLVEVKSVVVDLAKCSGKELGEIIDKEIKGLDIGILINNAGLGYSYPQFLHEVDLEIMEDIFKVNIEAVTWMVHSILPCMLRNKKGAILNIGSASSAFLPSFPFQTIYASSKGYLSMFSKSLSEEYKQRGIDIQCQVPAYVATKMTKFEASLFIPSSEKYSKASVRSIGYEKSCSPYWSHSLLCFIISLLPHTFLNHLLYSKNVALINNK
ncbi:very-long-chain 3-oxoacyl-CoA reductase 1 [Cannabis sativa]|uniref:very-long-chain 3-oxoacyl-CoA reductase 1 n=1 Tax=Cannabis sativa TaxID=3483 RepID=UPI0029CA376B|nr:very-long-chain 3-oxoacyl-CoA reductase 1 [Cannabis sativa]